MDREDIRKRHIEQLQEENQRLARSHNQMMQTRNRDRRKMWVVEIMFVVSVGLAGTSVGTLWQNIQMGETITTLRENNTQLSDSFTAMSEAYKAIPPMAYSMNYSLRSEQTRTGSLAWMLVDGNRRLDQCQSRARTLAGRIDKLTRRNFMNEAETGE